MSPDMDLYAVLDMLMETFPEDESVLKAGNLARLWIYTAKLKAEA